MTTSQAFDMTFEVRIRGDLPNQLRHGAPGNRLGFEQLMEGLLAPLAAGAASLENADRNVTPVISAKMQAENGATLQTIWLSVQFHGV